MNTPVSFSIAKLLKEKGFDKYCSFIWNEENLEEPYYYAEHYDMICSRIHYYGDIPMVNNSYIEKYATYVEKDEITEEVYELLTAPSIAGVVMWMYEERGIWVRVTPIPYSDNLTHWRWEHMSTNYFTRNSKWKKGQDYMSPTKAYEAAIEYCLTKLI